MMELGSADLVFLCFVCFERVLTASVFALKRTSLGSVLDCVAPCSEESLLSLAKLRLEEVSKSFTEHTKRVDVWLKNDSEKGL